MEAAAGPLFRHTCWESASVWAIAMGHRVARRGAQQSLMERRARCSGWGTPAAAAGAQGAHDALGATPGRRS